MHKAMVNIVLDRIKDQFISEEIFCQKILEIPVSIWDDWKQGNDQLPSDKMQKIKSLFSDYEWMIIQKMIRQTILFPEKRNYIVAEYKRLKSVIAKTWIKTGSASVELITHQRFANQELSSVPQKNVVNLRVMMTYDEWGYDDILEFFMPGIVQQQIEDSQIDLLEWVDENLVATYTEKKETHEGNE